MRFSSTPLFILLWTLASPLLAQSDCDVELDAELGVGPNGAYLFEASTDAMDASFQWNVNGSILEEGFDNTLEWYDILGAPFWEVCVVMETTEGCVAEDCFTPQTWCQSASTTTSSIPTWLALKSGLRCAGATG